MWIQLLRAQQIEVAGVARTYYPGDCVDVGKQTALRWIADGAAQPLMPIKLDLSALVGCGVGLTGHVPIPEKLETALRPLPVQAIDALDLPYARTLLIDPTYPLRPLLASLGFALLETWEAACPIASYDLLAAHVGDEVARNRTAQVIHDLRVPYYDPRCIFIRRCQAGRDLIAAWQEERASDDHDGLCLLRAIYRVKPLLCALPVTWNKDVPAIA